MFPSHTRPTARIGSPHTMAAAADEARNEVVRLGEVVVRGTSDLVQTLIRTSAELSEHEAVPFVSAVGHIVKLLIQHANAVGENDQYVLEAGRRARAVHVSSKIYSGIGIPLTAALPKIPSRPSSRPWKGRASLRNTRAT